MTATLIRPARNVAPAVELTLKIGGIGYEVEPIPTAPDVAMRCFRLAKADGTIYDVAQTRYGLQCDCPDFIFRRDGLDPAGCKHVKALVRAGVLERRASEQGPPAVRSRREPD